MSEVILTEAEENLKPKRKVKETDPEVTMWRAALYFNKAFSEMFPGERVKISKSGPYIVFRQASGATGSYAVARKKKGGGATVGTPLLMQMINPDGGKHTYPVLPVKGGGWCIKVR